MLIPLDACHDPDRLEPDVVDIDIFGAVAGMDDDIVAVGYPEMLAVWFVRVVILGLERIDLLVRHVHELHVIDVAVLHLVVFGEIEVFEDAGELVALVLDPRLRPGLLVDLDVTDERHLMLDLLVDVGDIVAELIDDAVLARQTVDVSLHRTEVGRDVGYVLLVRRQPAVKRNSQVVREISETAIYSRDDAAVRTETAEPVRVILKRICRRRDAVDIGLVRCQPVLKRIRKVCRYIANVNLFRDVASD